MINVRNLNVDKAYATRYQEIQNQLQLLSSKLEAHAGRTTSWGQVGDLSHVLAELEQINDQL
jgi:hypothetical protein